MKRFILKTVSYTHRSSITVREYTFVENDFYVIDVSNAGNPRYGKLILIYLHCFEKSSGVQSNLVFGEPLGVRRIAEFVRFHVLRVLRVRLRLHHCFDSVSRNFALFLVIRDRCFTYHFS